MGFNNKITGLVPVVLFNSDPKTIFAAPYEDH